MKIGFSCQINIRFAESYKTIVDIAPNPDYEQPIHTRDYLLPTLVVFLKLINTRASPLDIIDTLIICNIGWSLTYAA